MAARGPEKEKDFFFLFPSAKSGYRVSGAFLVIRNN